MYETENILKRKFEKYFKYDLSTKSNFQTPHHRNYWKLRKLIGCTDIKTHEIKVKDYCTKTNLKVIMHSYKSLPKTSPYYS